MTYRDKLMFVAALLQSEDVPIEARKSLADVISKIAVQVGHIEECLDDRVEEARLDELANHSPLPANVTRLPSRPRTVRL